MQLIDTHAHLTMLAEEGNLAQALERSRQAGVDRWITVGTDVADSAAAVELSRNCEGMYCTVGIHPHDASKQTGDYLADLRRLSGEAPVVAIGEIGLDYHYEFSPRERQLKVLEEQLELAQELALPVVIHCREAMDDCLAALDTWNHYDKMVVFHCFAGGAAEAEAVIVRGHYISFTGTLTFANADAVREAAQYVPLDRVFLETDCPYLAPEPKRKVRPNEPSLLVHTAAKLAEVHGMTIDEVAKITTQNSRVFFGLD